MVLFDIALDAASFSLTFIHHRPASSTRPLPLYFDVGDATDVCAQGPHAFRESRPATGKSEELLPCQPSRTRRQSCCGMRVDLLGWTSLVSSVRVVLTCLFAHATREGAYGVGISSGHCGARCLLL